METGAAAQPTKGKAGGQCQDTADGVGADDVVRRSCMKYLEIVHAKTIRHRIPRNIVVGAFTAGFALGFVVGVVVWI